MITLRKENVVKQVSSEARALELELKGFSRTDGKRTKSPVSGAGQKAEAMELELAETKKQLEAANKEIAGLKMELADTREQLETAVKQNQKAAAKK